MHLFNFTQMHCEFYVYPGSKMDCWYHNSLFCNRFFASDPSNQLPALYYPLFPLCRFPLPVKGSLHKELTLSGSTACLKGGSSRAAADSEETLYLTQTIFKKFTVQTCRLSQVCKCSKQNTEVTYFVLKNVGTSMIQLIFLYYPTSMSSNE